ncbi:MAG: hypothetical protein ABR550_01660 [Wenzhouxiangellaceae bacterium]
MNEVKVHFIRLLLVAFALGLVACASPYSSRHAGHSAYSGLSAQPGRAYGDPYRRSHRSINPVHYPYWSLDHFYFSRHYHPYSVFVGYQQPLYYPYPGWAYGPRYPRHGAAFSHGFGYPWQGFGRSYSGFSTGFFYSQQHAARSRRHFIPQHHRHPIRQIDQRLRNLDQRDRSISRRDLLAESDRIDDDLRRARHVSTRSGLDPVDRSRPTTDRAALRRAWLRDNRAGAPVRSSDSARALRQPTHRALDAARAPRIPESDNEPSRPDLLQRQREQQQTPDRPSERSPGIPVESLRGRVRVIERDRGARASGLQERRARERSSARSAPVVIGRQQASRARQLDRQMQQLRQQQSRQQTRQQAARRPDTQLRQTRQTADPAIRSGGSRQSGLRDSASSAGVANNERRRGRTPSAPVQRASRSEPSAPAATPPQSVPSTSESPGRATRGSSLGRESRMRRVPDSGSAQSRIRSRVRNRDQR